MRNALRSSPSSGRGPAPGFDAQGRRGACSTWNFSLMRDTAGNIRDHLWPSRIQDALGAFHRAAEVANRWACRLWPLTALELAPLCESMRSWRTGITQQSRVAAFTFSSLAQVRHSALEQSAHTAVPFGNPSRSARRRPPSSVVEAVEKPSDKNPDSPCSRTDRSERATVNATMLGKGQVTPENLLSAPLRGFFYSLVRLHPGSCLLLRN